MPALGGSGPSVRSGLHDVPTAVELVEAVREFLQTAVLTEVGGLTKLHTRVAINALAVVERELAQGGEDLRVHLERLAALGHADDAALAAAIRDGAEDERYAEVKSAIRDSVVAKLMVSNPGYIQQNVGEKA